ncbi:unnamed protein product [Parnassius mnemosyne]|uniref:THAP-type domain-containing protein n=1 Tax=Parnassius mnemosyne TaxID=213953 RepID=A0AAV1LSB4_9NEOP
MSCIIVGCKSHSSRKKNDSENINFHRFPTDINLRLKWIDNIARRNWEWKKHHRICSRHFKDDCFINFEHKWRRLKLNAISSLHLPDNKHYRNYSSPASTLATASTSSVSEKNIASTSSAIPKIAPTPASTTSTSTSDSSAKLTTTVRFSSTPSQQELISCVSKLEQDLEKLQKLAKGRLLKINSLRQKGRRLKNKNLDLKLRLEKFLNEEKIEKENLLILDSVKNNPIIYRKKWETISVNTLWN